MENKKDSSNAVKVYLATINSFCIYLNIMMIERFCSSIKKDWPELEHLIDVYSKFDKALDVTEADVNDEKTITAISDSAKEYLKELKSFKKLSEVQDDKIQELIDMGIKETSDIVSKTI